MSAKGLGQLLLFTAGALVGCIAGPRAGYAIETHPPDGTTSPPSEEVWEKFIPAEVGGIPGRYTVTLFTVPAASAAADLVSSVGGELGYVYRRVLNGFEAELTENQAIELSLDPLVKQVIQDVAMTEAVSSILPNCYSDGPTFNYDDFPDLPAPGAVAQQVLNCVDPMPGGDCGSNWGLDRVDQVELPIDHEFSFRHLGGNVNLLLH